MKPFAITLFLIGISAATAANEAGWDVERWGVHFTILFNDEHDEYDNCSVWRGNDVEYYLMKFDTPDPEFAREVHMKSASLAEDAILSEREVDEETERSGFVAGLETEYAYDDGEYRETARYLSDGETCFALIFSCPVDGWDDNEFYRDDFFTSVSKY
ncbi:MAG: hypothetical protein JSW52_08055 [Candidatus Coatesbacteria bacterium]|nr:MAG: hypothetical protein JSW52_08055 [Candidatus Coatesbacteria bacterium]